ncbi:hypothetical protein FB567DRAFT_299235 [Paraphoma chrysanthemicola]|uniref:Uncharacterized protein n=1 Tax=Paraphoma chrysanthemicola TaxID=798071 RepID=A0A8K0W1P2_9PLEO|nr:hypothetical protein FB567DRAFT_299235 [Paraphoma chrysanthemicola]
MLCLWTVTSLPWPPRTFHCSSMQQSGTSLSILRLCAATLVAGQKVATTLALPQLVAWQRYASMPLFASKILEWMQPVEFKDGPPRSPFAVVRLDTFQFIAPTPALLRLSRAPLISRDDADTGTDPGDIVAKYEDEYEEDDLDDTDAVAGQVTLKGMPVDGRPSCRFHFHCTLSPKSISTYYDLHHRFIDQRLVAFIKMCPK